MKLLLLIAFVLNSFLSVSQNNLTLLNKADSIVRTNTSPDFYQYLLSSRDTLSVYLTYPVGAKLFVINYGFTPIEGQLHYVKNIGLNSLGVALTYESETKKFSTPDFSVPSAAFQKIMTSNTISKIQAIDLAKEHFPQHARDAHMNQLVYQAKDARLTWRITRRKGFTTVTEETVIIDAVTSKFIGIDKFIYHRSFSQAISDWFSGLY